MELVLTKLERICVLVWVDGHVDVDTVGFSEYVR